MLSNLPINLIAIWIETLLTVVGLHSRSFLLHRPFPQHETDIVSQTIEAVHLLLEIDPEFVARQSDRIDHLKCYESELL